MRRLLALAGFVAVLALVLTLLWQVYEHHKASERYELPSDIVRSQSPAADLLA